MRRHHTKFAIIAFWTLFLVGCGPSGCGGSGSALPPVPTATPFQKMYVVDEGSNQVQTLDAATGQVRTSIPVGKTPVYISFDKWSTSSTGASMWVVNSGSNTVSRISTLTDSVVATIPVGTDPVSVVSDELWAKGTVWVANSGSDTISVIDKFKNTVVKTVRTAGRPFQLAAANHDIAIAEDNETVEVLDSVSNTIVGKIQLTAPVAGIAIEDVGDIGIETSDGVLHLYAQTDSDYGGWPWRPDFNYTLPDGAGPMEQSEGGGSIWFVASQSKNAIQVMGAAGNGLTASQFANGVQTFPVGSAPEYAGQSDQTAFTYVPNAGDNTISVINESTKKVTTWTLPSGTAPYGVAFTTLTAAATPSPSPTATPTVAPTATPTAAPTATPTAAPTSTPAVAQHLYVANGSGGNVLEYTSPFSSSSTPTVNLNIGGNVWGIAADSNYVAIEDSTGFIYIFAQPLSASASPVAQFQGFAQGGQLLFDSSGNLYTAGQSNGVLEFSPPFSNSSTPAATIFGDTASFSLAMDYNKNLYVGNLGMNQIDIFASPYTAAPTHVAQPGTYGLATFINSLYGADATSGKIDVYNLPMSTSSTPAFSIANTDPHALATDPSDGALYVGDQHGGSGSGTIDVYNQPLSGSSTAAYSISNSVTEPVEVWIGP